MEQLNKINFQSKKFINSVLIKLTLKINNIVLNILYWIGNNKIDKDVFITMPAIISPDSFPKINEKILDKISNYVSNILTLYKKSMIQYGPEEIKEFIINWQAIVIWDFKTNDLIGFSRYMSWEWVNEDNKKVIEIWTLIVNPSYQNLYYAKIIMKHFVKYLSNKFNNTLFIVWIEKDNVVSKQLYNSLGAKKINKPSNVKVLVEWVEFYNVWTIIS